MSDLNSLTHTRHPISSNRTPPPLPVAVPERDNAPGAGSGLLRVVGFIVAVVIVVAIKVGVRAMFR